MQYIVIKKTTHHVCSTLPNNVKMWENKNEEQRDIGILIQFKAQKYGNYSQEIIFDFGGFPKVIRKLGVQVASEETLRKVSVMGCEQKRTQVFFTGLLFCLKAKNAKYNTL